MMKHYAMDLRSKLRNGEKDNRGFTLVELIVVIVILAILAALLVPALVGWIDKAREKSYAVEARTVYLAAQTVESEHYDGTDTTYLGTTKLESTNDKCKEVKELSGVNVSALQVVEYSTGGKSSEKHAITEMKVEFTPAGGSGTVVMHLKDGAWEKIGSIG